MKNINLPSGQQLSKIMASKLLEHLGIGSLMEETSCQRSGPIYSPATDGWKKGKNGWWKECLVRALVLKIVHLRMVGKIVGIDSA